MKSSLNLPTSAVYSSLESPVGVLWMIASDEGLHALIWESYLQTDKYKNALKSLKEDKNHPVIAKTIGQLKEYFAGNRKEFDIPLAAEGTDFQKKAWKQLSLIPYGKTISYIEQARRLGNEKASRAVGTANGRNPISIIVPCHRVIATSGNLTGFGGGIHNKQFLLDLERS